MAINKLQLVSLFMTVILIALFILLVVLATLQLLQTSLLPRSIAAIQQLLPPAIPVATVLPIKVPSSGQPLLDTAINRTFALESLHFDAALRLTINLDGGLAIVCLTARGNATNLADIPNMGIDVIMQISPQVVESSTTVVSCQDIRVQAEMRMATGVAYFQVIDLLTAEKSCWVVVPMMQLIQEYLKSMGMESMITVNDASEIEGTPDLFPVNEILDLLSLGKYIATERIDDAGIEFKTTFHIEQFLDSPEDIARLLVALAATGNVAQFETTQLQPLIEIFTAQRKQLLPQAKLYIDTQILPGDRLVKRVTIDGTFKLAKQLLDPTAAPDSVVDIGLNLSLNLSGYGERYNVITPPEEDRLTVDNLDELNDLTSKREQLMCPKAN